MQTLLLPSVTVVIPTRSRMDSLRACLQQIAPYVNDHPECSIVVSDDGEAEEIRSAIQQECASAVVVQGPRRGPAANRNHGASQASGDLLVFLDDDCVPDSDLIAQYQKAAAEHPDVCVFEGRISASGKLEGFADAVPLNEEGGNLWSCNFGIRRAFFEAVGGFDERYPFAAMEDADLSFRIQGRSVMQFLPEARVWHRYERRQGWKTLKHHSLSLLLFLHIHGPAATERGPGFFLRAAVRMFFGNAKRHWKARALRDPWQHILQVWSMLQMALITSFWGLRRPLARILLPPCCPRCETIHALLAGKAESTRGDIRNSVNVPKLGCPK